MSVWNAIAAAGATSMVLLLPIWAYAARKYDLPAQTAVLNALLAMFVVFVMGVAGSLWTG